MTEPGDTPETVALRHLQQDIAGLRSMFHEELSGIRKDITSLSGEMRSQTEDVQPRIATLEIRTGRNESDIEEMKQHKVDDRSTKIRMWSTLGAAALGVVGSWAFSMFGG